MAEGSFNWGRVLTAFGILVVAGLLRNVFEGDYALIGKITSLIYAFGMVVLLFAPDTSKATLDNWAVVISHSFGHFLVPRLCHRDPEKGRIAAELGGGPHSGSRDRRGWGVRHDLMGELEVEDIYPLAYIQRLDCSTGRRVYVLSTENV